jgi:hypothetical protein
MKKRAANNFFAILNFVLIVIGESGDFLFLTNKQGGLINYEIGITRGG